MKTVKPSIRLINSSSVAPIQLGYWTCYLLDAFEENRTGVTVHTSMDSSTVYRCPLTTRFLSGNTKGPTVCLTICVLITFLGILGLISNVVNIMVLRKITPGRSLNKLLILLAVFDLVASCFATLTAVFLQIMIDNTSRSNITLLAFRTSFLLYSLGRTGSVFITVLVTVERYLVVVYSSQTKAWLTSRRSNIITGVVLIGILLINIPWWLNSVIMENNVNKFRNRGGLSGYPYIFAMTTFGSQVYFRYLRPFHIFIDFVLPLPLLLIFHGLLYKFIFKWTRNRESLISSSRDSHQSQHAHHGEIKATKMFSLVVVSLFFCHSFGIISVSISETTGILYRELQLATMMAIAFNAMINLVIYYFMSQGFRDCFWKLIDSKRKASNENELRQFKN